MAEKDSTVFSMAGGQTQWLCAEAVAGTRWHAMIRLLKDNKRLLWITAGLALAFQIFMSLLDLALCKSVVLIKDDVPSVTQQWV